MLKNNWYIITGGPSTGKTTLLTELGRRGYRTVPEAARSIIDEGISRGETTEYIRADEKLFQEIVAKRKADIEASLNPAESVFLDRGMQDTIAYMRTYSFDIADWIHALCEQSRYKTIFLLEPLDNFAYDYARTEDKTARDKLQKLLEMAYTKYGMEPVRVPALSPSNRADFVLNTIRQERAA